ncbi:MAG: ABC transporter ATP-binding protein [Pseudomonadales bacterium]
MVVDIAGLEKQFRRFSGAGWRALDALGIPVPPSTFDEFRALKNVDLQISKGERVALIGRNGAGKSTLLRIIAGQMKADKGTVVVRGAVQALMELGTGFHPDFTGEENIRSALSYQGVSSRRARALVADIVEFTELDDFISRPVREYSAGMYSRLAFAVATTIDPEILIVDEILGAGDAYFLGKCVQRMKDLTHGGTTVLFVSHDMSSIQPLCDRGVWLDRGSVLADGDLLDVIKAYSARVRHDEEIRIRARLLSVSRSRAADLAGREAMEMFRLIGADPAHPVPAVPVAITRISYGTESIDAMDVDLEEATALSRIVDEPKGTNWSPLRTMDGRSCRLFGDFGGRFLHAPFQIDWSGIPWRDRVLEIEYRETREKIALEQFHPSQAGYVRLGELAAGSSGEWRNARFSISAACAVEEQESQSRRAVPDLDVQELSPEDRYGTGPLRITAFGFFDEAGERRHTLITGECAGAVLVYNTDEPVLDPVAVIAVYRPDGSCAMQVISNWEGRRLGELRSEGTLVVGFDPLLLGPGDYIVSVAMFKDYDLSSNTEPDSYDLHDRCYPLKILPPVGIGVTIGTVNQPVTWELRS